MKPRQPRPTSITSGENEQYCPDQNPQECSKKVRGGVQIERSGKLGIGLITAEFSCRPKVYSVIRVCGVYFPRLRVVDL